jgi:ArsR family transcriptional regulator, arsenate/arsenite/antimonite-responsive transcriptional repressor
MKRMVRVFKILSDKNRLRILKLLEHRKLCVCELSAVLGITQPSVSRHLKKLKSAGLINDEQQGFWTNYFLNKTDDKYGRALMSQVRLWLNDDPLVSSDRKKASKVNRSELCCKRSLV